MRYCFSRGYGGILAALDKYIYICPSLVYLPSYLGRYVEGIGRCDFPKFGEKGNKALFHTKKEKM